MPVGARNEAMVDCVAVHGGFAFWFLLEETPSLITGGEDRRSFMVKAFEEPAAARSPRHTGVTRELVGEAAGGSASITT